MYLKSRPQMYAFMYTVSCIHQSKSNNGNARTTDMLFPDTSRTPCLPIISGYLWCFMCSFSKLIFHRSGHWVHSRLKCAFHFNSTKHFWSFSIAARTGSDVKCFLWVETGSLILMKRMLRWLSVDALLLSVYRQCERACAS